MSFPKKTISLHGFKTISMNDLDIWSKLPQKGDIYVYDDYEEVWIHIYMINDVIMCKFKRKGIKEKTGILRPLL